MERISILAQFLQKSLLQTAVGLGFLWNRRIGLKSEDVKVFPEGEPQNVKVLAAIPESTG